MSIENTTPKKNEEISLFRSNLSELRNRKKEAEKEAKEAEKKVAEVKAEIERVKEIEQIAKERRNKANQLKENALKKSRVPVYEKQEIIAAEELAVTAENEVRALMASASVELEAAEVIEREKREVIETIEKEITEVKNLAKDHIETLRDKKQKEKIAAAATTVVEEVKETTMAIEEVVTPEVPVKGRRIPIWLKSKPQEIPVVVAPAVEPVAALEIPPKQEEITPAQIHRLSAEQNEVKRFIEENYIKIGTIITVNGDQFEIIEIPDENKKIDKYTLKYLNTDENKDKTFKLTEKEFIREVASEIKEKNTVIENKHDSRLIINGLIFDFELKEEEIGYIRQDERKKNLLKKIQTEILTLLTEEEKEILKKNKIQFKLKESTIEETNYQDNKLTIGYIANNFNVEIMAEKILEILKKLKGESLKKTTEVNIDTTPETEIKSKEGQSNTRKEEITLAEYRDYFKKQIEEDIDYLKENPDPEKELNTTKERLKQTRRNIFKKGEEITKLNVEITSLNTEIGNILKTISYREEELNNSFPTKGPTFFIDLIKRGKRKKLEKEKEIYATEISKKRNEIEQNKQTIENTEAEINKLQKEEEKLITKKTSLEKIKENRSSSQNKLEFLKNFPITVRFYLEKLKDILNDITLNGNSSFKNTLRKIGFIRKNNLLKILQKDKVVDKENQIIIKKEDLEQLIEKLEKLDRETNLLINEDTSEKIEEILKTKTVVETIPEPETQIQTEPVPETVPIIVPRTEFISHEPVANTTEQKQQLPNTRKPKMSNEDKERLEELRKKYRN